ncbi:MAG: DNA translocase FtsK 4TM domain-containing protein [Clostridia bacterium]|nr:DNA translocase FtsK 4TM domain-containing protein [Clostridia bacterium]
MPDNKKKETYYSKLRGFNRAVPIILLAVALFIGLCFVLQDMGSFGRAISGALLGLFSYGAYAIPLLVAIHAVLYPADVARHRRVSRLIFSVVAVLLISSSIYAFGHLDGSVSFTPVEFYSDGQALIGGGFIGSIVAFGIIKALGVIGYFIVAVAVIAVYITYFIARNNGSVARVVYGALSSVASVFASAESKIKKSRKIKDAARAEKRRRADDIKRRDLYHDDYFEVDNGMQELSISELGIKEARSRASVEMNPNLSETVHHKSEVANEPSERVSADDEVFFSDGTITVKMSDKKSAQSKTVDLDYGEEFNEPIRREAKEPQSKSSASIGIDDDADAVFTKDFDPFDFVMGEKLAFKPSSKASEAVKSPRAEGVGVFTESINNLTEEDVAKARRQAEFEERKKKIIERENAYRKQREEMERASASTASNAPSTTAYTSEAKEEPKVAEPKSDFSVKQDTSYAAETNSYAPTVEEIINIDNEIDENPIKADEPVEFKPYAPRTEAAYTPAEPSAPKAESIRTERSMLDPTPSLNERIFTEKEAFSFDSTPAEELVEEISVEPTANTLTGDSFDFDRDDVEIEEPEELDEITVQPEEDEPIGFGEPIPESEQSQTVLEQRRMFTIFDEPKSEPEEFTPAAPVEEPVEDDFSEITVSDYTDEEDIRGGEIEPEEEEEDTPPFDFAPKPMPAPVAVEKEEPKAPAKPDYSDYRLPPIDLLGEEDNGGDEGTNAETAENANKLIETLASFNVTASIKGFDRGPRITRYEVVPARGVKVSSIMNLFDDIALNLAAEGIRMEAPIPGKSAVGVEIPNSRPYVVRLRSLLETEEFAASRSKTIVCMGKDVAGQPVFGDVAKMPHVLIAGATGMGKSVCINSLLLSILYKAKPDEVKLIMIDPKKVEFNIYNGIPHLLIPVVTDPKQAAGALMWAVEQMEKRYEMIEKARVRNIEAYNAKVLEDPTLGEPMPKIVIVVDELADLMLQVKNPVEGLIMSIAQKARAAGIHLIIGTQRPSVDIITGVIKANIPTRISCKVMSNADSRTILDMAGAEKLLDKGDMLFNPAGASRPKRVQGAFVSDSEVESIIEFIKAQVDGNVYDDQAIEEINRAAQKCSKDKGSGGRGYDDDGDSGDDGGLYNNQEFLDAVDVAVSAGKISTSLLQRKLSIGFGKAAKFIDGMEDLGIVSGPNGQKPRDVLISKDEWHEKLSRVSLD